jgi:hypothetical protein
MHNWHRAKGTHAVTTGSRQPGNKQRHAKLGQTIFLKKKKRAHAKLWQTIFWKTKCARPDHAKRNPYALHAV